MHTKKTFWTIAMMCLLMVSHTLMAQTPSPWVAIQLWIVEQPHQADTSKASQSHTIKPAQIDPYQQLALNITHDQLPLLSDQNANPITVKLHNAGYHILYMTSWQQPDTSKATLHYLVDPFFHANSAPEDLSTETETDTPPNINYDATQRKLRDTLPQLFSGPDEILDANHSPSIQGKINISLDADRHFQATLLIDQYANPDDAPMRHWHITQQLSTRKINYIDHSALGAIIQIRRVAPPTIAPASPKPMNRSTTPGPRE